MRIETTNQACPLCRSAAASSHAAGPTRLCQACRLMIEAILPKRASSNGAASKLQHAVAGVRQIEVAAVPELEMQAGVTGPLPQDDDYEMVSLEPALDGRKDFLEEPEESLIAAAGMALDQTADETLSSQTEARVHLESSDERASEPEMAEMAEMAETAEMAEMAVAPRAETQAAFNASHFNASHATALTAEIDTARQGAHPEDVGSLKAAIDESATDPWDDPLPAWEYSHNEWPILLRTRKRSTFSRLKIPIAIASLLIAFAAIAYFIFIKQSARAPQEPISVATPEPKEPPATASAQQPRAATDSNSAAQATSEKQESPAQTAATAGDDTKWRHSLQAMASQNAEEASQFVERLVRAGIPAYVVSANLGNRGNWHRVRVGRFATADEALRYASEARARAKAAGVTLKELNLCEYEKP